MQTQKPITPASGLSVDATWGQPEQHYENVPAASFTAANVFFRLICPAEEWEGITFSKESVGSAHVIDCFVVVFF